MSPACFAEGGSWLSVGQACTPCLGSVIPVQVGVLPTFRGDTEPPEVTHIRAGFKARSVSAQRLTSSSGHPLSCHRGDFLCGHVLSYFEEWESF